MVGRVWHGGASGGKGVGRPIGPLTLALSPEGRGDAGGDGLVEAEAEAEEYPHMASPW